MKSLKVSLLAIAMLVGIAGAFAFKTSAVCEGQIFRLDPALAQAPEAWVGQGQILVDQTASHYIALPANFICEDQPVTCTVYFDNADQKFKQCEEGLNTEL